MVKLLNVGNTCAINSLLQCINSCKISVEHFKKPNDNTLSKALLELLHLMQIYEEKKIKPTNFLKLLYNSFTIFRPREQLDSQEVWTLLSNKVFEETSIPINLNKSFSSFIHQKAFKQIAQHNNNKTSLWNDIFQGVTLQILVCQNCHNRTYNFETFYSLSINMCNDIVQSLQEYFTKDITDEIDCENCKRKHKQVKFIKFYKLPKFLVISLNRYNNLGQKMLSKIDINTNIMLSHNILYENKNNINLTLLGHINHFGSINSGHYNAVNYQENIIIDDDVTLPFNTEMLKQNSSVYMLFYQTNLIV